jgi:hypothetical protein
LSMGMPCRCFNAMLGEVQVDDVAHVCHRLCRFRNQLNRSSVGASTGFGRFRIANATRKPGLISLGGTS